MNKCPACDGKGVMTIKVHVWGSKDPEGESCIPCVVCEGTGEVSDEELADILAEQAMWCECGNPSEQTKYYADYEHHEVTKHHWRCKDCGKVVQIG